MSTPGSATDGSRVTIVVPVYSDWPSLRDCIVSLMAHAHSSRYDVLLVNDCGPDVDEIEAGILGLITGHSQFRYARNPKNLGFVATCNRAVNELDQTDNDVLLLNSDTTVTAGSLDELRAVLALSESHGVVCPRSNDATIATIPFFRRETVPLRSAKRARAVFDALSEQLPRFYVAPVSVGFCLLIRRALVREFGLFDPVFGAGYSEENDLCMRLNQRGISSLIANHAFVYHVGSSSFGTAQRATLDEQNSRIVLERYPHYTASVISFVHDDYHPVDRFADLLVDDEDPALSILISIDLETPTPAFSASRLNVMLQGMLVAAPETARITVACANGNSDGLSTDIARTTIVDAANLDAVYDLGVVFSPVTSTEQLITLNRHCLRWLFVGPESRPTTTWAVRTSAPEVPVIDELARRHADTIVRESPSAGDAHAPDGWWRPMSEVLSRRVSFDRLVERNHIIRNIGIVVVAARRDANGHELRRIRSSRSFRLAQKISALARAPRALTRR